jgi:hypothetical protein
MTYNQTLLLVRNKFMSCSLIHMMIADQECGQETTWAGYDFYREHISKGL